MIRSFASKAAQDIYDGVNSRYARKIKSELHDKIRRLFDQINAVITIDTLRIPPGNRLEKLSGDFKGEREHDTKEKTSDTSRRDAA